MFSTASSSGEMQAEQRARKILQLCPGCARGWKAAEPRTGGTWGKSRRWALRKDKTPGHYGNTLLFLNGSGSFRKP